MPTLANSRLDARRLIAPPSTSFGLFNKLPRVEVTRAAAPRRKRACAAQRISVSEPAGLEGVEPQRWEEEADLPDNDASYFRDTLALVLRMLTERALQRVMQQLLEVDPYMACWLNTFAAKAPLRGGEERLIQRLLTEPTCVVINPANGLQHTIEPPQLARRILQVRADLVRRVAGGLPPFVALDDAELLGGQTQGRQAN